MGDLKEGFWNSIVGWIEKGVLECQDVRVVEGLDAEAVNEALDAYAEKKGGSRLLCIRMLWNERAEIRGLQIKAQKHLEQNSMLIGAEY